jgi:hypothetical protein
VYTNCGAAALTNTGLDIGTAGGQVTTTSTSATGYVVSATSKSGTHFTITKSSTTGVSSRGCDNVGQGGCKAADAQGNQW